MKKLILSSLLILGLQAVPHAQYKGKYVGWSTGYIFTGSLNSVNWNAVTHFVNFQVTVSTSGGIGTGSLAVSHSQFVSACHQHGVKALVCVGGAGESPHFSGACSNPSTQTKLVQNIVNLVKANGYDGMDMDWEAAEEGDDPAMVAKFKGFHKQLRDSINAMSPKPLMTAAVATDWYPNCTASIAPYLDQMNNMSYYDRVTGMDANFAPVIKLGVTKTLMSVGFGFDTDNEITDQSDVIAKCRYAIDNGYGGIMIWDVTHASAATMDSVAHYVTHNAASTSAFIADPGRAAISIDASRAGAREISYSVPTAGIVDLGLYDMQGSLVKSLRGYAAKGSHTVTLDAGRPINPGNYVIKVSALSETASAKARIGE